MILIGTIISQVYYNKENGYSIYKVELENGDIETIVGYLPPLQLESTYKFETKERVHKIYGVQYEVISYEKSEVRNKIALINYLSSPAFTGIGPVRAARIVNHLGLDAVEKILENKNILRDLLFTPLQIERLYQEIKKDQEHDHIMRELIKREIPLDLSTKLYAFYGKKTLDVLNENPYQIINDIIGVGFLKIDKLAFKMGISSSDQRRVEAGIIYALNTYIFSKGHTYLTKDQLDYAIKIILKEVSDDDLEKGVEKLIFKEELISKDNTYTLVDIYNKEKNIATNVLKFQNTLTIDDKLINNEIENVEKILNIDYTKEQKEAIKKALSNPLTIITGGPGTGKTTMLYGLILTYAKLFNLNLEDPSIVEAIGLCAPTGRAARRMQDVMDIPAFTIHKLLGYDYEGKFSYDEENLLPQKLIVIDESSMIDIYLMEQLLKSINENAKVIIVGDKDQLPSVGPGQVLEDMILSNQIEVIELVEIHRQAENSGIIELATQLNNQTVDSYHYNSSDDIHFIKKDLNQIFDSILKLLDSALENGYNLYNDIQILIPKYKGRLGIDAFNYLCQSHLINKESLSMQSGVNIFYENDKVIQLINAPEKNIMNGDIGKVLQIYETKDGKLMIVDFDGNHVTYQQQELIELSLAYAISIHKSQGSEYKIVFMPLANEYSIMLRKELLYTGITRAKSDLYLLGEMNLIEKASKILNEKRQTKLRYYLSNKEIPKVVSPFDFM